MRLILNHNFLWYWWWTAFKDDRINEENDLLKKTMITCYDKKLLQITSLYYFINEVKEYDDKKKLEKTLKQKQLLTSLPHSRLHNDKLGDHKMA